MSFSTRATIRALVAPDHRLACPAPLWRTLLKELSGYSIGAVIYTDIARHRMRGGPNVSALREIVAYSPFPVIASGGISRIEDLKAVRSLGPQVVGAIVGKALYDGKLEFRSAVAALEES